MIYLLENTYKIASSEKDFYQKLQHKNLTLYSRNNTIIGVKLKRKFRFRTLGYNQSILKELDQKLTQNKRLNALKRIRQHQETQEKLLSKGRERTRK